MLEGDAVVFEGETFEVPANVRIASLAEHDGNPLMLYQGPTRNIAWPSGAASA